MTTTAPATPAPPAPIAPESTLPRTRGRRRTAPIWLALIATSLPMFTATLDNLVMTSALAVVHHDPAANVDNLAWFVNAYTLAFAPFMLPAATLGDRWGRRRVML